MEAGPGLGLDGDRGGGVNCGVADCQGGMPMKTPAFFFVLSVLAGISSVAEARDTYVKPTCASGNPYTTPGMDYCMDKPICPQSYGLNVNPPGENGTDRCQRASPPPYNVAAKCFPPNISVTVTPGADFCKIMPKCASGTYVKNHSGNNDMCKL